MHENREISSAPSVIDEGRSVKAHSRTTDTHALEKSDCAVLPVNRPNKGRQLPAEAGEGRAQMKENIDQPHMLPTQRGKGVSQGDGFVTNVRPDPVPASATCEPDPVPRFSCFSSASMSAACWYRRFLSFCRALRITSCNDEGMLGFTSTGASGSRLRIASAITPELGP